MANHTRTENPVRYVTLHDAAERVGVTQLDIEDAIHEGLPYLEICGYMIRVSLDDLDEWYGRPGALLPD